MRAQQMAEDSEQRRLLTLAVQSQLSRVLSNSPDELAEYIVVLLAHGKSEPEMGEALSEFLQDQAPRFAAWLFSHLERHRLDYGGAKSAPMEPEGRLPASLKSRLSRVKRDWRSAQEGGAGAGQGSAGEGAVGKPPARRPLQGGKAEVDPGDDAPVRRCGDDGPASKRSRLSSPVGDGGARGRGDRRAGRAGEPPSRLAATALKSLLGGGREDKPRPRPKATPAKATPAKAAPAKKAEGDGDKGGRLDVFKRLGGAPADGGGARHSFPPGIVPGGRTSVFKRLADKPQGVNMQVRMDNRTIQGGQSTTFMVTVDHAPQVPQSRGSFDRKPAESAPEGGPGRYAPSAPKKARPPLKSVAEPVSECPPGDKKDRSGSGGQDAQSEVERLRMKLGQMEEDIAKLRAKGLMLERESDARAKGEAGSPPPEQPRSPTSVMADIDRRCVVVQNVHFHATKEVLAAHFGQCGRVADVTFVLNTFGFSKGYAFVEFQDASSVEKALALSGSLLMHRVIKVIRKETRLPGSGSSRPPDQASPSPFHPGMAGAGGRGWRAPYRRASGGRGPRPPFSRPPKGNYRYVRGGSDPFPAPLSTALSGVAGMSVSGTGDGIVDGSNVTGTGLESASCEPASPGSMDLEIMCPPETVNSVESGMLGMLDGELGEY